MPTKTRLDPTAGGSPPPAEPDRAHGSGRGDNSSSASAALPGGDITGFIDSLSTLAAHLRERESFEALARRSWSRMAFSSFLLVPAAAVIAFVTDVATPVSGGSLTSFTSIVLAALFTASLAAILFSVAAAAPWRASPDSVDRVALRHEDSPLRDRIRITQWILFDTVFTRFTFQQHRVNAAIAYGVLTISGFALVSIALVVPLSRELQGMSNGRDVAVSLALLIFLVLVLASIVRVSRTAKQTFVLAQHYGRQVLAFDADFGGFLARAEKEHVENVVKVGGAKAEVEDSA
jgi:hypothetical protein